MTSVQCLPYFQHVTHAPLQPLSSTLLYPFHLPFCFPERSKAGRRPKTQLPKTQPWQRRLVQLQKQIAEKSNKWLPSIGSLLLEIGFCSSIAPRQSQRNANSFFLFFSVIPASDVLDPTRRNPLHISWIQLKSIEFKFDFPCDETNSMDSNNK